MIIAKATNVGNVKKLWKKRRRHETTEVHHRGHREKEF